LLLLLWLPTEAALCTERNSQKPGCDFVTSVRRETL
jgi:hypothetical protein